MRNLLLAGVFALAAGQAGAVAVSDAAGSIKITLSLVSGDAGDLAVGFFGAPERDLLRDPADPGGLVGGTLVYETPASWPAAADAPLPLDAAARAKITAEGAPPPAAGMASGLIDDLFSLSMDVMHLGQTGPLAFDLSIEYALDAMVAVDHAFDEYAFAASDLVVNFGDPFGAFPAVIDESVEADSDFGPTAQALANTVSIRNVTLDAGAFVSLDVALGVRAEATSAGVAPIPAPPALALLPAGLAALAAAAARRRRRAA